MKKRAFVRTLSAEQLRMATVKSIDDARWYLETVKDDPSEGVAFIVIEHLSKALETIIKYKNQCKREK